MSRQSKPPINWFRVESLMRTSIRRGGQSLDVDDMAYLARALREDRKKY